MSDIIHILPDHVANQIAAGEVIQRPASVIKELMENAVDADARNITVHIKDAGRTLIQVKDDGKGMSETDARMAFERHATSKIAEPKDLFGLHTMGFRGEALASMAAVSQIELRTHAKGVQIGTKLVIAGSKLESIEPDACAEGSIFSVKNIFYNVPARRKFLKSNEAEFRNILIEFERVALVNPNISFVLFHNDTEVVNLPASVLRQRILNVFGKKLNAKLFSFDVDTSLVKVEGFIGRLDTVKRRGYLNYFFVNGRYMRHPYFHRAVMQAYEPLIATGETPDYFIYLTLDPSTIDVNIHPTKTEIKFENEQPIWQILFSAIRETLAKSNAIPTIDFDTEGAIEMPVYNTVERKNVIAPQVQINTDYNPFRKSQNTLYNQQDWEVLYKGFEQEKDLEITSFEKEERSSSLNEGLPSEGAGFFTEKMNPCFQYKNRFIITPLKSGLVLIDQHRAHVRILYDQYIANVQLHKKVSQKLLFPEVIELTLSESANLPVVMEDIEVLGFELVPLGKNSYSINAIPAGLTDSSTVDLVKELINDANEFGKIDKSRRIEKLALSLAKSAAISVGKSLTFEEMESIVGSLFATEGNNMTPEGKIIMSILTDDELDKLFKY